MMYLTSAGLSPTFFKPGSMIVSASCTVLSASIRMTPSLVRIAHAPIVLNPKYHMLSKICTGSSGLGGSGFWPAFCASSAGRCGPSAPQVFSKRMTSFESLPAIALAFATCACASFELAYSSGVGYPRPDPAVVPPAATPRPPPC